MFLAKKINKKVAQLAKSLSDRKTISHEDLAGLIYQTIKPFGSKLVIHRHDKPRDYLYISGFYECDRVRQPIGIELHLSQNFNTINLHDTDSILFLLFQTLCHELIHKYQYQLRDTGMMTWYYELDDQTEMNEDQLYLAEVDEIDAYAHDIALELVYHFPDTCMQELQNIQSKAILSYQIYLDTFVGTRWFDIRKQLMKKTYQHITQILDKKEHYHV